MSMANRERSNDQGDEGNRERPQSRPPTHTPHTAQTLEQLIQSGALRTGTGQTPVLPESAFQGPPRPAQAGVIFDGTAHTLDAEVEQPFHEDDGSQLLPDELGGINGMSKAGI
jgi:hypothetical protein